MVVTCGNLVVLDRKILLIDEKLSSIHRLAVVRTLLDVTRYLD